MLSKHVPAVVLSLLAVAGCSAPLSLEKGRLHARDGLTCRSYAAYRDPTVRDVIVGLNGTGTGSSAFVPPAPAAVLATRPVAYVTFDKPGISARFGDPIPTDTEPSRLARHTFGTLLDCVHALHDASRRRFGTATRFHFRGHSEGALLALAFLDELTRREPEGTHGVRSLVLSGLPLETFPEIVQRQLAVRPRLSRAVSTCDTSTLLRELGLGCAYLADMRTRPSGLDLFARLATRAPATRFRVFHGERDEHTPARFVHDLEAWNRVRGHLDLTVRYYDGAHRGTPEVRRELTALLLALVSEGVDASSR